MANWRALRIKRVGARVGAFAFGIRLPLRVLKLPDLPAEVRKALAPSRAEKEDQVTWQESSGNAMTLSRSLKDPSINPADEEFTWAIVGDLIAEEQFVQAANAVRVAGDAVEHSDADLVARLGPLVKGHRYAPYIESYAFPKGERLKINQQLEKLQVVDARASMARMLVRAWDLPLAGQMCGSTLGVRSVEKRAQTVPAFLEAFHNIVLRWNQFSKEDHNPILNEFKAVSPHSPQARRLAVTLLETPTSEEIKQLEESLGDDPLAWMTAASKYKQIGDDQNAMRCYQKSLDISPCFNATSSLASIHYALGDKAKWQETLESHLELEDLGLTHAHIHRMLADEHVRQRDWESAEPHAVVAAETYSGWGLTLASQVYEGMEEYKKSEHYIAESARSYPSSTAGTEWYFWCHRTGTGDLERARAYAAKSIRVAGQQRYYDSLLRVALYRWLKGDLVAALTQVNGPLQQSPDSVEPWTRSYNTLIAASIASELEDDDAIERSVAGLRGLLHSETIQQYPDWITILGTLADTFSGQKPSDEFYTTFDKAASETSDIYRCDYCYFLGAALERVGEFERADRYYRFAALQPPFNRYTATLAGRRLVARHGQDRGSLPGQPKETSDEAAVPEAEDSEE